MKIMTQLLKSLPIFALAGCGGGHKAVVDEDRFTVTGTSAFTTKIRVIRDEQNKREYLLVTYGEGCSVTPLLPREIER